MMPIHLPPKEECIRGTVITDINDFMYKLGFTQVGNIYQIQEEGVDLFLRKLGFSNDVIG